MRLDQIPGLATAAAEEAQMRERAFLPLAHVICGVPVLPLTLRHLTLLHAVGSPLVVGGASDLAECARYLWIVSPHNLLPSPQVPEREVRAVRKAWIIGIWPSLTRRGRKLISLQKAIARHVTDAMFDIPIWRGGVEAPVTHFCASVIDEFASAYSWPRQLLDARGQPVHDAGILDIPFAQLVQIRRCRTLRTIAGASLANPYHDALQLKAARADALRAKRKSSSRKGVK
jgi:hypothetical protein